VGRLLSRFEDAGLKIIAMKMLSVDKEKAGKHYGQDIAERHSEKVRNLLLAHITEGPVLALVLEGPDAIAVTRKIIGPTYPNEAPAGTIRGDFGHVSKIYANKNEMPIRNFIHASADKADSDKEIPIWFEESELSDYKTMHEMVCFKE
jgi:nucleoside-diphosphate kinase